MGMRGQGDGEPVELAWAAYIGLEVKRVQIKRARATLKKQENRRADLPRVTGTSSHYR